MRPRRSRVRAPDPDPPGIPRCYLLKAHERGEFTRYELVNLRSGERYESESLADLERLLRGQRTSRLR